MTGHDLFSGGPDPGISEPAVPDPNSAARQPLAARMRPRTTGRSSITAVRSIYYIVHVLLGVFVNVLKFDQRGRRPARRSGKPGES